jgi:hypothetical protein
LRQVPLAHLRLGVEQLEDFEAFGVGKQEKP